MRETTIHDDVEVEHVVDAQQIRWQHGADAPAAPVTGRGRGCRSAVAVRSRGRAHRRVPRRSGWPASPVPIRTTGERQSPLPTRWPEKVSPNTATSLPSGAIDRRTEIGGGHAPPVGDSRAGQIGELAVGRRESSGQRGLNKPAVASAARSAPTRVRGSTGPWRTRSAAISATSRGLQPGECVATWYRRAWPSMGPVQGHSTAQARSDNRFMGYSSRP